MTKRKRDQTILVIDDTPTNLLTLGAMLAAEFDVQVATSGAEGLALVDIMAPDLILLDIMMPDMDGFETCRLLKASESSRNIPVIFMTARGDAESEARCFAVGAVDFVTKPINLPVLQVRINTHLAQYDQRRSLESMFRNLLEFALDAFILSNSHGEIVQINDQAELLFGYDRQELIGLPIDVLLSPEFHASVNDHPTSDWGSLTPAKLPDIHCRRKDGTNFPAEISQSPLQTDRELLSMSLIHDLTERRQVEQALEASNQRLRDFGAQNEAIREADKKHIAREVHDELGQVLTALRMDLSIVRMRFGPLHPDLMGKVQDMKVLIDRAIQGVRNVAMNLRPVALDMGLVPAIEWLVSEFRNHNNVVCRLHLENDNIPLDDTRSVVLFRIVQESLTNISRYAHASQVDITLRLLDNELQASVRDNGRGFDTQASGQFKTMGLLGMRERALALGGLLDINSRPGQGTLISLSIPIKFDRRRVDHDSTANRR
jgi:PAS domain S-box-containing protein